MGKLGEATIPFQYSDSKIVVLRKKKLKYSKPPTDGSVIPSVINNAICTKQILLNLERSW
jgi:hypothetical protein